MDYTASYLENWQTYLFRFGQLMVQDFEVDVSTKLHRTMYHVSDHSLSIGCILRGSLEENEVKYKLYKSGYNSTNKHIDTIAVQLLRSTIDRSGGNVASFDESSDDDNDFIVSTPVPVYLSEIYSHMLSETNNSANNLSDQTDPGQLYQQLLGSKLNGVRIWKSQKRVRIPSDAPKYSILRHTCLYSSDDVFSQLDRHDGVLYK